MAKKTFESALTKLEQIAGELEAGNLPLDKSLKKFDEGIALVEFCSNKLEEAEKRIELLLNKNGDIKAVPFAEPPENTPPNSGPTLS